MACRSRSATSAVLPLAVRRGLKWPGRKIAQLPQRRPIKMWTIGSLLLAEVVELRSMAPRRLCLRLRFNFPPWALVSMGAADLYLGRFSEKGQLPQGATDMSAHRDMGHRTLVVEGNFGYFAKLRVNNTFLRLTKRCYSSAIVDVCV